MGFVQKRVKRVIEAGGDYECLDCIIAHLVKPALAGKAQP
jgi:hypothetical protein